MAKPIFIIETPNSATHDQLKNIIEAGRGTMPDYHVLAVRGVSENFEFHAFYEKDFNETKFEELKKLVIEKMI